MASFTERIAVIIDVTAVKATKGLKDFKSSVQEAEGFTGKLRAGVGSLGGAFQSAAANPAMLATGVTAAAVAAFEAVSAFSRLGVEVGKFSTATGVSTEEASRLIEVSNDLGISTESLESALNKMNKGIDPKAFNDLGVAIASTDSGATDVNGTFLNVIDHLNGIEDPAQRAREGTRLLGKSWIDLARFVGMGAGGLQKALAGVSDAKVLTPEEQKKAERFEQAMNDLRDVAEDLVITFGEKLAPAFSDAANNATSVSDVAGFAFDVLNAGLQRGLDGLNSWGSLWDWAFGDDKPKAVDELSGSLDENAGAADKDYYAIAQLNDQYSSLSGAGIRAAEATDIMNAAIAGGVSLQGSYVGVIDSLGSLQETLGNSEAGWVEQQNAIIGAQNSVIDYVNQLGGIPPEKLTQILAMLSQGNIDGVLSVINEVTRERTIRLTMAWKNGGINPAEDMPATPVVTVDVVPHVQAPVHHSGGAGGGGGGGKSPTQTQAEKDAEALKRLQDIEDNKYELGVINDAAYRKILEGRLRAETKYSDEYTAIAMKIKGIDDKTAKDKAAKDKAAHDRAEKAKKDREDAAAQARRLADEEMQRQAMRAIVNADILGASYANIYTSADPNAVVNAIQQWQRRNGPVPIRTNG